MTIESDILSIASAVEFLRFDSKERVSSAFFQSVVIWDRF
jgi:hypothetical protein